MNLTFGEEILFRMFSQLMTVYEKGYLYISQNTMMRLLGKYHNYNIQRRMLGYILAALIKKGLIKRRSRNQRTQDGAIEPMTTLTFITKKGHKLLVNRIKQAWRAANKTVKAMLKYERKRKPQPAEQPLSREDSKEKARELFTHLACV